jgi:predicted DNA-binding protein (UPF0251 family)
MVRPRKKRCIEALPGCFVYKPAGVPARNIERVHLNIDEFETIRLLDHIGMDQTQAAENMQISRPTVTRIYASARKKIADALTMGMAIEIENAEITPASELSKGCGMRRVRCGEGRGNNGDQNGEIK